jgi:hypothetical protein
LRCGLCLAIAARAFGFLLRSPADSAKIDIRRQENNGIAIWILLSVVSAG